MANKAAEAKIRFLEASARHYASSAPETSAHLMQQRNVEAAESGVPVNRDQLSGSCKGCGSILVPGWTSRTSIVRKGGKVNRVKVRSKKGAKTEGRESSNIGLKNKSQSIDSAVQKYVKVDCLVCYRFEQTPLLVSKAKSKHSLKVPLKPAVVVSGLQLQPPHGNNSPTDSISQTQSSKPLATNTSSKKRAKARQQGGLQAMLEKSKASSGPSSGFGLDLLDFMKQG